MIGTLDPKVPPGPLDQKWRNHQDHSRLVSPNNRRKLEIIVVGSGLAGASAAASLAELGYRVTCFCFQDSPRRAHSIAAQGGINAAKNYQNDGDSVSRLFHDTIKGGDFRSREANVYRLAQLSLNIIDQCVAQGVPFAREYGGLLDTRSFGGAQVSRTFYARGQTGQQLLLGAYQALERQVGLGTVTMHTRAEMLDLVVVDGRARGIVTRNLVTGAAESHVGDAVVLATGGYGNVFYADPSDVYPDERRAPVEAHADERVAAQRRARVGADEGRRHATAGPDPDRRARLLPGAEVPELRQSVAARHRLARGEGSVRRETRRRPRRARGLPRLRRRHRASRRAGDPRKVRQPLRHVRAHHRGERVPGPDADLSRRPLHDGRSVGRLQPDVDHSRAVRRRRGELLRPRREPP